MKKIIALMLIFMCLAISLTGCNEKEDASLNDLKPMIMVNGKLYLNTGIEEPVDATKAVIDGEILSTVQQTEKPTEDGQSNFGAVGNSYYVNKDAIIVYLNDKWFRFESESDSTYQN